MQTRSWETGGVCSLPVKFEVTSVTGETASTDSPLQMESNTALQRSSHATRRSARNRQMTQKILRLDIAESTMRRWQRIGMARKLSSDSDVALFLIQHYEDTMSSFQSAARCSSCHAPLTLNCVTCNLSPGRVGQFASPCNNTPSAERAGDKGSCRNRGQMREVGAMDADDITIDWKKEPDLQVPTEQTPSQKRNKAKRKTGSACPSSPSPAVPQPPPPPPQPQFALTQQRKPAVHVWQSAKREPASVSPSSSPQRPPRIPNGTAHADPPKEITPFVKKPLTPKKPAVSKKPLALRRHALAQKSSAGASSSNFDAQGGKVKRRHVCGECGATFSRSGGLKVHLRIHTGEKPYRCEECGMSFNQTVSLIVHKRKHSGERPYVCTDCGSSFPLASTLKQHSRIHSGERPFSCQQCLKTFSRSGDLTSHLRVHTGARPFLCQDCGKRFASSSDLTKHKRTHTGDRPFQCPQCHKRFPFPHRLTAHMRSHTGDKPYLCTVCGAAFARASNLTVHFRTHTGDKPFECEDCGKRFSDSGNLCKHRRTAHGGACKKAPNACEKSAGESGASKVGLCAVLPSRSKMSDTAPVLGDADLSSLSVPLHQLAPTTLPSSSALGTNSFLAQTAGYGSSSRNPFHSEGSSLPTKQEPISEVFSSFASAGQNCLGQFASSSQGMSDPSAAQTDALSPFFDGGDTFLEEGKNFPALAERTGRLPDGEVKCKQCAGCFSDHIALARHCQTLHKAFTVRPDRGEPGGQEECVVSYQVSTSSTEEQASLLPCFSSAALSGIYFQS